MDSLKPLAALLMGLAAASVGIGQDDPQAGDPASSVRTRTPPPRMTRQPDFFIPFQLADNGVSQPVQVRLYVSSDQGTKWKLYQRQPPRAAKFQFHAPTDGEYWFAVRTVDRHGKLAGREQWRPELIVVVDRQSPRLELQVEADDQGNIHAAWVAHDPNLAAHTFRLQYRNVDAQEWEAVPLEKPEEGDWRQQWEQQADWWLRPTGDEILVRAEVSDRAGNATLANKTISLARVAQREEAEGPPSSLAVAGGDSEALSSSGDESSPAAEPWPEETNIAKYSAREALHAPVPGPKSDAPGVGSSAPQVPWEPSATEELARAADEQPLPSQVAPPVAQRYVPPGSGPEDAGQRPRIISSPDFELAYDLYDVGPNGASLVDLWYTRDDGKTWERYGSDDDAESPVAVRLPREGLYGFRLVVYSRDAPEPRPPQDGEPADIWVGVDWTKPVGHIVSARYGEGVHKSSLVISWQAEDALLGERPITLNFSETPGGPWIPIAAQLPNSGSYTWQLDQRAPPQLYLQLEVRDLAGNITSHEFERPIVTQGHAPQGRIRDLRPIHRSMSIGPRPVGED